MLFGNRVFGKSFGTYCVMGNFGSGKTSGTFKELSKYDKKKTYIIANVNYSFVDKFFNTPDDLNVILNSIVNYCKITNRDIKKYFNERFKYKDIILVVDEAHLYFDARKWKDYSNALDVILSQCRKRNIKCFFISQRLKRVDLNIRRLSDFVVRYSRMRKPILPNTERVTRYIYSNEGDLADIQGDDAKTYIMNGEQKKAELDDALITQSFFSPLFKLFGRMPYKSSRGKLSSEYHNTLYISGLDCSFVNANDPFLQEILVKPEDWTPPKADIEKLVPTFYSLRKKLNAKGHDRSNRIQGGNSSSEGGTEFPRRVIKPRNGFFLSESGVNNSGTSKSDLHSDNGGGSSRPQVQPPITVRSKGI